MPKKRSRSERADETQQDTQEAAAGLIAIAGSQNQSSAPSSSREERYKKRTCAQQTSIEDSPTENCWPGPDEHHWPGPSAKATASVVQPDGDVAVPPKKMQPRKHTEQMSAEGLSNRAEQAEVDVPSQAAAAAKPQTLLQSKTPSAKTEAAQQPKKKQTESAKPSTRAQQPVSNVQVIAEPASAAAEISTQLKLGSVVPKSSATAAPWDAAAQTANQTEATPDASAELTPRPDATAAEASAQQAAATAKPELAKAQTLSLLPFPPPESVLQNVADAKADRHVGTCARAEPWSQHPGTSDSATDDSASDDEELCRKRSAEDTSFAAASKTASQNVLMPSQSTPSKAAAQTKDLAVNQSKTSQADSQHIAKTIECHNELLVPSSGLGPDQGFSAATVKQAGSAGLLLTASGSTQDSPSQTKAEAGATPSANCPRNSSDVFAEIARILTCPSQTDSVHEAATSPADSLSAHGPSADIPIADSQGATMTTPAAPPSVTTPSERQLALAATSSEVSLSNNSPTAIPPAPSAVDPATNALAMITAPAAPPPTSEAEPPWAALMQQMLQHTSSNSGRLEVLMERMLEKQEALLEAIATQKHG